MRMQTSGTVALPGRHCWLISLLCTDLYSQNFIYIVQSRLPVHENWKRGDSNPSLCGMVACKLSCGIDISGSGQVCQVAM